MRRPIRAYPFVLIALAFATACGGSSTPAPASQTDTTVLVYIVGSDLESGGNEATKNIEEMWKVGSQPGKLNIVVQTGGANKPAPEPTDPSMMTTAGIDWTHVQRYVVNQNSLQRISDLGPESTSNPALNMGDPETLGNFLDWGVTSYPAKKYLVVLWDHGGGVNGGVGPDENTNQSKLSVPSIVGALLTVSKARNVRFELTGFDACYMATAEVASGLALSSNFMVASEDIEEGSGWNWQVFMAYVLANPNATGKEIGIAIADGYAKKQEGNAFTLSVVDLSKLPTLSSATDAFSTQLARYIDPATFGNTGWKTIAKGRAASLDWGTSAVYGGSYDLVDAYDLVSNVLYQVTSDIGYDDAFTGAATDLFLALENAIAYNVTAGSNQGATGLTLYFPSVLPAYTSKQYPDNTSRNGVSYFAPLYTTNGGFARAYWAYSVANGPALGATVTMSGIPAAPLEAVVSNDHDNVLAAHQVASCSYWVYDEVQKQLVPRSGACYDAAQIVRGVKSATSNEWLVTFTYDAAWPRIRDASGNVFPIALLPDQYAATKLGRLNSYLVPVWKKNPDATYAAGYLTVDEYYPVAGGPRALKVTGFQLDATVPGKSVALGNATFAIGVYVAGTAGYYFHLTDNEVTAKDGALTIDTAPLSGGNFGYILTDLLGKVSLSGVVPYAAR